MMTKKSNNIILSWDDQATLGPLAAVIMCASPWDPGAQAAMESTT